MVSWNSSSEVHVPIKVRVRNFQSIEDAEIEIKGLTVLTGTNNAGKSALFRAVRGAFTNARGSDFVRIGKDACTVDVTFDDGQTLTWEKGRKGVNSYIVNGKRFDKVGHGVPPEAQKFGVSSIRVADTELWPQIAPQLTGVMFLLDQPGSVIAEAVADVERVNQLSRALKASDSDRRTAKNDLKLRVQDGAAMQERRAAFVRLDEILQHLEGIEKRNKLGEQIAKAFGNLDKLGSRWRRASEEVRALDGLDEAATSVPSDDRIEAALQVAKTWRELSRLHGRLKAAQGALEAVSGLEEAEAKVPSDERMAFAGKLRHGIGVTVELVLRHDKAVEDLRLGESADSVIRGITLDDAKHAKAGKFTKALATTRSLKTRYVKCRDDVAELAKAVREAEMQASEVQAKLTALLGNLAECPTCGGGLDHVHQTG